MKNYHKDGCEIKNNIADGHTCLKGCERYVAEIGVISAPPKSKGFPLAELKIHLLAEFSDKEMERLIWWLQEISKTISKEKGKTADVYSLKLMK